MLNENVVTNNRYYTGQIRCETPASPCSASTARGNPTHSTNEGDSDMAYGLPRIPRAASSTRRRSRTPASTSTRRPAAARRRTSTSNRAWSCNWTHITQTYGGGSSACEILGQRVGMPTTGQKGQLFIVTEVTPGINDLAGTDTAGTTTANLRKGGLLSGYWLSGTVCYAWTYANMTAGTTMLAPDTSGRLIAATSTSVAESLARVGSTATAFAVAMETADTSSTAALKKVCIWNR